MRTRRSRARLKDGLRVFTVICDEDYLSMVLVAGGHLSPLARDVPEAIQEALQRMLDNLCAAVFED